MPEWTDYENQYALEGYGAVCGIDEAGRGPLAGPVFAAAVILPPDFEIEGLDDSKKLSEKKRESLFKAITESDVRYSIAMADEKEIDELNILRATFLAMKRAVSSLGGSDFALVDGNCAPPLGIPVKTIIKGDKTCKSIAAASILAKVGRDRFMTELDKKYPDYMFAKHKGYGTKLHYELIGKYGISPVHRMSFLKNLR